MKRIGLFAFLPAAAWLLGAALCPLGAQAGEGAASRTQADAFLSRAQALLAAGNPAPALELSSRALELSPDYSEALYLRCRIELADRATTTAALDDLRAALHHATWTTTDPLSAEQMLAGLLLRTGRTGEARAAAGRLEGLRPEDPQNLLLVARSAARAGDANAAQRALAEALARFPLIDDFRLLSSALLEKQGRTAAARDVVATGLKVHPDSMPLLLTAARLTREPGARISAVDLYLDKGGSDPLGALLGLESAPASRRAKYLDLFLSQAGLSRLDLIARAVNAAKAGKDLSATLASALSRYTGTRDLDADGDGFWEDRWTFENGQPTGWRREPAQDGVAQFAAEFRGGVPSSLAFEPRPGQRVRLTFSRYPFVESAAVEGEGTYFLVPYTVQATFLRSAAPIGPGGLNPAIAQKPVMPGRETIREGSYRREEYAAGSGALFRRAELAHGRSVFVEESTSGDGVLDHRIWYSGGEPVRGERSLARDGIYQVTERWANGVLASEAIDTNGDGRAEYHQFFGARPMRTWDYNGDGREDSREYEGAEGTLVRELATRLNGVFDVKIVSRSGRIVSLTRAGTPAAVIPDADRGVTWIGRAAAQPAKPDPTQPDGVQSIDGTSYLVFHLSGVTYVEELE